MERLIKTYKLNWVSPGAGVASSLGKFFTELESELLEVIVDIINELMDTFAEIYKAARGIFK